MQCEVVERKACGTQQSNNEEDLRKPRGAGISPAPLHYVET